MVDSGVDPSEESEDSLYLWIKVEERFNTLSELILDTALVSVKQVHGDAGRLPVFQFNIRILDSLQLFDWQKPQPVDQSQISHIFSSISEADAATHSLSSLIGVDRFKACYQGVLESPRVVRV